MSLASEKIKKARESKGWSQSELASKLGIGLRHYQNIEAGQFPKYKRHQVKDIEDLLGISVYAEIYEESVPRETADPAVEYTAKRNQQKLTSNRKRVPFFDAEATAGNTEMDMSPIHAPAGTIDVGDLLHDSAAALRIYGNSMLPNYPPGCVLGITPVNSGFIEPGEVYVIETADSRLFKRLFYKDDNTDGDKILCYSDNTMKFDGGARDGKLAYPPFEISKSDIRRLFAVNGVIKRNRSSVIIHKNH